MSTYTYTETQDLGTTASNWSGWGTPVPLGVGRWEKCHWRIWTHKWQQRQVTVTTTFDNCPSGYIYIGGGECERWELVYDEPGGTDQPSRVGARPRNTYSYGPWSTESESWSQVRCEYYSIWQKYQDPLVLKDLKIAPKDPHVHHLEDLRIVQGDRLTFRGGREITSLCMDGAPIDPRRTIEAAEYEPGMHVIDLYGRHRKRKVRFQFQLEIVPSLGVVVPEPTVSLHKGSDEVVASIRVVNQTAGELLVRAEVASNPEGWVGTIVGSPVKRLPKKKAASFRIRARLSDEALRRKDYQAVGFRVTPIGDHAQPARGVVYVRS